MSGAGALNGSVLNHELIFGGGSPRGELGSGDLAARQHDIDVMSANCQICLKPGTSVG
jgi:hypothetical protein